MLPNSGELSATGVPQPFATLGLTFDDVLLQPNESDVIPSEVKTQSRVPQRQGEHPAAVQPMDTVTEARMAIAMARQGGLGVLHRNLSIEDQAQQVDLVKRSESGMIDRADHHRRRRHHRRGRRALRPLPDLRRAGGGPRASWSAS